MIDLDSLDLTIAECSACHQPVALPRTGDAGAPCAYCGASQDPIGPPVLPEGLREGVLLRYDLRSPPPGLEAPRKKPRAASIAALRPAWEETKATLAGPHLIDDEFRATWLAATLARLHGGSADAVRERAVLETAFSRVAMPAYRALLGARLARAAAFAGRLEMADRWLAALPPPTGIAEVDADVEVARALVLLRRDRHGEVLSILGASDEGSALTGQARILGDLIRIDAIERMGDRWGAYALYRKAVRVHGAVALQDLVLYYGVARGSRRLVFAIGALVILVLIPLVAYLVRAL